MISATKSYLTFAIGDELFGIIVSKVLEIREYQSPKPLPQSFPFVNGVIEYHDEIIPLIDTGVKFGLKPVKIQPSTCIVVLQLVSDTLGKNYRVAILVDNVSDVMECNDEQMKPISDDYSPEYIQSTITENQKFIYILNADKVFNQKEIISILENIKNKKQ